MLQAVHQTSEVLADVLRASRLRMGEGAVGRAVAERKVVASPDVLGEPGIEVPAAMRARLASDDLRAIVAIPLLTHERIIGALGLSDRTGREFTPDELQTVQAFADQAALAFENARLYATAQDSLTRLRDTQAQLVQAAKMSRRRVRLSWAGSSPAWPTS